MIKPVFLFLILTALISGCETAKIVAVPVDAAGPSNEMAGKTAVSAVELTFPSKEKSEAKEEKKPEPEPESESEPVAE
ncbi:MAG: hypothetical protein PWQ29_682 [Verrucomicrobiota bacterium]|jgi:hypothetical protein|nr:hypothetical protein [Verrucomicrobiota bacterium]